jgi:antitoxin component of RelBE/YafQ-DinJ toxin-antitoxin module
MMKTDELHIRIDPDLKLDVKDVCFELDMSLTNFIVMALKNEVQHQKLALRSVSARYEPQSTTQRGHDVDTDAIAQEVLKTLIRKAYGV